MEQQNLKNVHRNTFENLKEGKMLHSGAQWCTLVQAEAPGWTQAGRQQEHGRPAGQIIIYPDGTATWYSPHTH